MTAPQASSVIKPALVHRLMYLATGAVALAWPAGAALITLYVNDAPTSWYASAWIVILVALGLVTTAVRRVRLEITDSGVAIQNFFRRHAFTLDDIAYCDAGVAYPVLRFALDDGRRISCFALPQTLRLSNNARRVLRALREAGVELRDVDRLRRYGPMDL